MFKKSLKLWAILITLHIGMFGLLGINTALAAQDNVIFTPGIGIPNSEFQSDQPVEFTKSDTSYIGKYIKAIYNYGLGIAGIAAAITLMLGGYLWVLSNGNAAGITNAKEVMTGGIVGLLIIFCSWIILNTISPDLMEFKITNVGQLEPIKLTTFCTEDNGPISVSTKDGQYFYGDTEQVFNEPGVECQPPAVCSRVANYANWQCVDKATLTCCQYKKNSSTGITCQTVKTSDGCPASRNGNELETTYPQTGCVQDNNSGRNPCVYE